MIRLKPDQYVLDQVEACRDAWTDALISAGLGLKERNAIVSPQGDMMRVVFTSMDLPEDQAGVSITVEAHEDIDSNIEILVTLRLGPNNQNQSLQRDWVSWIINHEIEQNNLPIKHWTSLPNSNRVPREKIQQFADILDKLILKNEQRMSALPQLQAATKNLLKVFAPLVRASTMMPVAEVELAPVNEKTIRNTFYGTFYGYFEVIVKDALVSNTAAPDIFVHVNTLMETAVSNFSDSGIKIKSLYPRRDGDDLIITVNPYFKQDGPLKIGSSIRAFYASTPKRANLKREARQAMAIGDTLETDHLRIHRFMDSVRIWDLTNAGKRGKRVDVAVVYDLDYIKENDIATAWFEQWLSKTVAGATFDQAVKDAQQFKGKLEQAGVYPIPKISLDQTRGIDVDPPQSIMKKLDFKVVDTPGLTLTVFATPSRVAIREVTFILNKEGKRGTYLHDITVGNTENRKEKLSLYSWVIMNENRLKQAQNLTDVKEMLKADGIPYDTFYLD